MRISGILFVSLLMVSSCASVPSARLESQLIELGLSDDRAFCLADELKARLDTRDYDSVTSFVTSLNDAQSPGEGIDALLSIDNPVAAQAIARAAFSCAF